MQLSRKKPHKHTRQHGMSFQREEYSSCCSSSAATDSGGKITFLTHQDKDILRRCILYIYIYIFFFSISLYFHTSTQPRPPGQLCQLILNCLEDDCKGHSCRLLRGPPSLLLPSPPRLSTPPSEGRETATLADVAFIPLKLLRGVGHRVK